MSKKIVILGCENSHANAFLNAIKNSEKYDVEVLGVYSDEQDPPKKLAEEFGVPVMEHYTDGVGKVDGVIITARHGDNHYKYAKPYLSAGIPLFIDKPITVSEEDAIAFAKELKAYSVPVTGGSSCRFEKTVLKLKKDVAEDVDGKTLGGYVRAPLNSKMGYGGFYFYSQHLVEIVGEIYGRFPKSVQATAHGEHITVVFHYEDYDVTGEFTEGIFTYYAARSAEKGVCCSELIIGSECFEAEFDAFYDLLEGKEQELTYEAFMAPVFVLNAIQRSLQTGKAELIGKIEA